MRALWLTFRYLENRNSILLVHVFHTMDQPWYSSAELEEEDNVPDIDRETVVEDDPIAIGR